jgi:hypothetical protein
MSVLVQELKARLKQLQAEAERDSRKLQELTASLATRKRAIQAIEEVIRIEGGEEPEAGTITAFPRMPEPGTSAIAEGVFESLSEKGTPTHYFELTDAVMRKGVRIGGKNPHNTLLAHLSRDSRFYRPGRGTYALKEWNPNARSVGVRRKKGA